MLQMRAKGVLTPQLEPTPFFRNVRVVELLVRFSKVNEGLGNGNDKLYEGWENQQHSHRASQKHENSLGFVSQIEFVGPNKPE